MKAVMMAAVLAAVAAGGARAADKSSAWLHVRVEEPRKDSKVEVNLPLSVVGVALSLAPEEVMSEGRIHLHGHHHHGHDLSVADLRKLWIELRSAEGQLVSIKDEDAVVSVERKGDQVVVHVDNPREKDKVDVQVPLSLVDALLSGTGSELDVKAALAELQKMRGDIVRVDGHDGQVHVWIDERS